MSEEEKPGTHTVRITRGVSGGYGWALEITGEGVDVETIRATVDALRAVDSEMRAPKDE